MPHSSLPTRPNLEHLRNQAKDLLRAYKSGDPSAVSALSGISISHYSDLTDDALVRDFRCHSATPSAWLRQSMGLLIGCICGATSNERTAAT